MVAQLIEQCTHFLEEVGSSPTPGNIFSIYLNEELNQMENNKNKNKNSSNSLVFGRWPQTKMRELVHLKIGLFRHLFRLFWSFLTVQ